MKNDERTRKRIVALETENAKLREWIRHEGDTSNICTYDILREICNTCQCGKAAKQLRMR